MSVVSNLNDSGAGSLRQAIADSNSNGSDVTFTVTTGTIVLASDLPWVSDNYDVIGPDTDLTVDMSSATLVTASVTFKASGLIFDGGKNASAQVYCINNANITFEDCTFQNYTLAGACIQTEQDVNLSLTRVTIKNNSNSESVACYSASAPVCTFTLNDCVFDDTPNTYMVRGIFTATGCEWKNANDLDVDGGAVTFPAGTDRSADSSASFTNCDFSNISVTGSGGAVSANSYASLSFTDCTFDTLHADSVGGALYPNNSGFDFIVTRCLFKNCSSGLHGGVVRFNSSGGMDNVRFQDCSFDSCSTAGEGGVVDLLNFGTPVLTPKFINCTFDSCSANLGGALYLAAESWEFSFCTFRNCSTINALGGGAIRTQGASASVQLDSCAFQDNTANAAGQDIRVGSGGSFSAANTLVQYPSNTGLIDGVSDNKIGASYDPNFSPINDNGGNVQTCAINLPSDAEDAGSALHVVTSDDARGTGFPRNVGAAPDMGAFELQGDSARIGIRTNVFSWT